MPSYNANLTPPPNTWGTGPDGRPKLQLPPGVLEMLANRQTQTTQPGFNRNPRGGGFMAQPGAPVPFNPGMPIVPGAEMSPGAAVTPDELLRFQQGIGGGAMSSSEAALLQQRLQGQAGGMPPTGQLNAMPDKRQLRGLMDYLSR